MVTGVGALAVTSNKYHSRMNQRRRVSGRSRRPLRGHQFDLPYMVEQWDDTESRVEELIALTGDYRVARAAYEEAPARSDRDLETKKRECWRIAGHETSAYAGTLSSGE